MEFDEEETFLAILRCYILLGVVNSGEREEGMFGPGCRNCSLAFTAKHQHPSPHRSQHPSHFYLSLPAIACHVSCDPNANTYWL